jgi:hypothetical protein
MKAIPAHSFGGSPSSFSARPLRTRTISSWGTTLSIHRLTRFAMPRRTFPPSGHASSERAVCKHTPRPGSASAPGLISLRLNATCGTWRLAGEEQHYGRAAHRLRVAQPALSRQIQDLEEEVGFKLFERLPRGVKLSAAGKLFLADAKRILHEVNEATLRAGRVARGDLGTLRIGFPEHASWFGVVPDSFRRFRKLRPNAELQLQPAASLEQLKAIRSGRLDAGFVFNMPKADPELDQLLVGVQCIELALAQKVSAHKAQETPVA